MPRHCPVRQADKELKDDDQPEGKVSLRLIINISLLVKGTAEK